MKLPQFRLRTLFVMVALFSIPMAWAAYQLNWIRQRHAFAAQYTAGFFASTPTGYHRVNFMSADMYTQPPPWSLRLFGEQQCPPLQFPRSEARRFNELFSEGTIVQK